MILLLYGQISAFFGAPRLAQMEAAEVITHLAFYVGWPNAFLALPVAKEVFDKRPR